MQTHFSVTQLQDPQIAEADKILRACVHCGFCTATCPTFVITGDERDSPRGRIWMMREVLENPDSVSAQTAFHIDRCLGCLSCTTTCPSGVDYPHLLDIGRDRIDRLVPRAAGDRFMRRMLAMTIPYAGRFRMMMKSATFVRWLGWFLPAPFRVALKKLPKSIPPLDPIGSETRRFAAQAQRSGLSGIKRVVLLAGCAQRALDPDINASTVRLLSRLGVEVIVRAEAHCCGALAHHIGETTAADRSIRATIRSWHDEIINGEVDAIVTNASGCGTMIKDYGHLLNNDPELAIVAREVSAKAMDISEVLASLDWKDALKSAKDDERPRIAYHSACSLQHGQKIHQGPIALLKVAGFDVVEPVNGHLCCGSAGVYNILQPDMADALRQRKWESLNATNASFVAAGNIGCIAQLDRPEMPVRHLVQFLDWATGGPTPR